MRTWTLRILGVYVSLVACLNVSRMGQGTGSAALLVGQLAVIAAAIFSVRRRSRFWRVVGDWLPLIALPLLYWELPWATVGSARDYDGIVQRWDLALFGSEPARTMAAALPSRPLSEILHLAYLLYYAIIYLPPAMLYAREPRRGYYETVLALTVTVVISFAAFSLFPVAGPRFLWGAPVGVPNGPIRSLTLLVLEHGSARGTAFPSSHVAIALAESLSMLRWRRGPGWWVLGTTVLLAVGAVYGGFHYAADILAGIAVGTGAWSLSRGIERGISRGS